VSLMVAKLGQREEAAVWACRLDGELGKCLVRYWVVESVAYSAVC